MTTALPQTGRNETISFEPQSLSLLSAFDHASAQIMERSVLHARLRSATVVLPEDVHAALQDAISSIQAAFAAVLSGNLSEVEFTDAEFTSLGRLPFKRDDSVSDGDDDL